MILTGVNYILNILNIDKWISQRFGLKTDRIIQAFLRTTDRLGINIEGRITFIEIVAGGDDANFHALLYTGTKAERAIVGDLSFSIDNESATLKYCEGCALEQRKAGEVDDQEARAVSIGEVAAAVRDVWNATFTLLFTLVLFTWGLLKNASRLNYTY